MNDGRYIFVDSLGENAISVILSSNEEVLLEPCQEPIEELSVLDLDTTMILAGSWVTSYLVTMPSLSQSQFRKALPFALEEKIAEDLSKIHFAYAPTVDHQLFQVLIISKEKFANLLETIQARNVYPEKIIPDYLALPYLPNAWTILAYGSNILVRENPYSGYTIPKNHAQTILAMRLEEIARGKEFYDIPQSVHIYTSTEEKTYLDEFDLNCFSVMDIPVIIEKNIDNPLIWLSENLSETPTDINLLQGDFSSSRPLSGAKRWAIIAASTAGVWFFLVYVMMLIHLFVLHRQNQAWTDKVNSLYTSLFPGTVEPSPSTIESEIQQKVSSYKQAENDKGFLRILSRVGTVLAKYPTQIKIQSFNYQNNKLSLDIRVNNSFELEKILQDFSRKKIIFTQDSLNEQPKFVEVQLSFSEGGSS